MKPVGLHPGNAEGAEKAAGSGKSVASRKVAEHAGDPISGPCYPSGLSFSSITSSQFLAWWGGKTGVRLAAEKKKGRIHNWGKLWWWEYIYLQYSALLWGWKVAVKGGWNPTLRSERPSKLYSQGYGRMKLQATLQAERGVGTIGEAGSINSRLQQTGEEWDICQQATEL